MLLIKKIAMRGARHQLRKMKGSMHNYTSRIWATMLLFSVRWKVSSKERSVHERYHEWNTLFLMHVDVLYWCGRRMRTATNNSSFPFTTPLQPPNSGNGSLSGGRVGNVRVRRESWLSAVVELLWWLCVARRGRLANKKQATRSAVVGVATPTVPCRLILAAV